MTLGQCSCPCEKRYKDARSCLGLWKWSRTTEKQTSHWSNTTPKKTSSRKPPNIKKYWASYEPNVAAVVSAGERPGGRPTADTPEHPPKTPGLPPPLPLIPRGALDTISPIPLPSQPPPSVAPPF